MGSWLAECFLPKQKLARSIGYLGYRHNLWLAHSHLHKASSIHGELCRYYFCHICFHYITTPCCGYWKHCRFVRFIQLIDGVCFSVNFSSYKRSSKQAMQNSIYFIAFTCDNIPTIWRRQHWTCTSNYLIAQLSTVAYSLIIARILYALPTWGGFITSEHKHRINAFKRIKFYGYIDRIVTVDDRISKSTHDLFNKMCIPSHCLHSCLPIVCLIICGYVVTGFNCQHIVLSCTWSSFVTRSLFLHVWFFFIFDARLSHHFQ